MAKLIALEYRNEYSKDWYIYARKQDENGNWLKNVFDYSNDFGVIFEFDVKSDQPVPELPTMYIWNAKECTFTRKG